MAFDSIDKIFRDMLKRYNNIFGPAFFDPFSSFGEPVRKTNQSRKYEEDDGFETEDSTQDEKEDDVFNNSPIKDRKFGYEIISGSDMKEPIIRIYGNPDEFPELKGQLEKFIKSQLGSLPGQQDFLELPENNVNLQHADVDSKVDQEPYTETFKNANGDTIINIDLPGIKESDLLVKANGKSLLVEAMNGSRNFKKTVSLDDKIDEKAIQWKLNNGILEIKVPKKLS